MARTINYELKAQKNQGANRRVSNRSFGGEEKFL